MELTWTWLPSCTLTHTTYGLQLTGDMSEGSRVGQLSLTQHKKKIYSIGDWTKAFSTFISVYIQKPGWEKDAIDLLTYMHEVQSIAEHGLDWASYDEMYRRDRAATRSPPSWSSINQTIHNFIMRVLHWVWIYR